MKRFSVHQKLRFCLLLILVCCFVVLVYILQSLVGSIFSCCEIEEIKIFSPDVRIPQIYGDDIPHRDINVDFTLTPAIFPFIKEKENVIILFVKSHPIHFMRRELIRKSWASYTEIDKSKIVVVFYVGTTKTPEINNAMRYESDCFHDILQMNVKENFKNLTLKTLSSFHWITQNMKNHNAFYIFTDDDCVVDWQYTITFLNEKLKYAQEKLIYCGFQFEEGTQPVRGSSKLSVPWQQYPSKYFPKFCRGVMVLLTYSMIESLYEVSTTTNYGNFPLEDVMIYGILRYKLHLPQNHIFPVRNGGNNLVFYPWDNSPSVLGKMARKWKRLLIELKSTFKLTTRDYLPESCDQYDEHINSLTY